MAQERQPFRGFARDSAVQGDERGAALLDTSVVRAARVTHIGGATGSTQLPVVTAEAAAAILNAGTPITSSLPQVEVAAAPAAPSPRDLGAAPIERAVSPVDAAAHVEPTMPTLESAPVAAPAAPSGPEIVALAPSAHSAHESSQAAPSAQEAATVVDAPTLEPAEPASEHLQQAEDEPVVPEAPAAVVAEPAPPARRPAQPFGGTGQVSASAGDFEAFASTATASAAPMSRTPLGVDPELRDDPDAGAPDLEPEEPLVAGAGAAAPAQPDAVAHEVDDSVVILEEPVLIAGGEIIRPRTMQTPVRPQPAEPATLTPNPDSRDDLARAADPAVAGQELMGLATHRRAAVRAAVAARPDLPATVVVFLSRDHSSEVLTSLLRNPRVPASTVRYLADHRDPRVADLAVQRLRNDFR